MKINKIFELIKIKIKNKYINKNINLFIKNNIKKSLSPRETNLKPEILIPCFNHGKYLKLAIKNIPNNIPITIINDCSTDNTLEIIKDLQKNFKFNFINNETNLNQAGSLNKAINISNNNLFIILNADDVFNNLAIKTILFFFETLPNIRMFGAGHICFSDDDLLKFNNIFPEFLPYIPKIKIFNKKTAEKYSNLNDINMTMSGCSFLKSAWEAVGGFYSFKKRVCSYDDRDFQMRVSTLFDVAIIQEPLTFYRTNSSTEVAQK